MRKEFFEQLYRHMKIDSRIWLLVGDLGYPFLNKFRDDFPDRFLNCGVAEQNMIGVAVGLANGGKIPFVYSITPFLIYRPYEFIRILVHYDKSNVKLVASGRDGDYGDHNYSHISPEDKDVMSTLYNIKSRWPEKAEEIPAILDEMIRENSPYYLNLKRT